jgi:DNA-binding response OmpR family regulator
MAATPRTILVATSERSLLRLFTRIFELEGDQVFTASTGQQVLTQLEAQTPDLLVLDLDLSLHWMGGFTVCQCIRQVSQVPMLLMAALWQDQQLAQALAWGADDYMLTPFHVNDLLASTDAVLSRASWRAHDHPFLHSPLRVGELILDVAQPLVRLADRTVVLTPVEYGLLVCLAQRAGSLVQAGELLEQVWGAGYAGKHLLLQATITRLRQKLESDPVHPRSLLIRARQGYYLADPAGNSTGYCQLDQTSDAWSCTV